MNIRTAVGVVSEISLILGVLLVGLGYYYWNACTHSLCPVSSFQGVSFLILSGEGFLCASALGFFACLWLMGRTGTPDRTSRAGTG